MSKKTYICLYTYGGGMRGIIPALIMAHIEERTGFAMADMVDIFAGPSTGSILNSALNIPHPEDKTRPKYKARHLVRFYEREGLSIFPKDAFRDFRGLIHDFNNRLVKIGKLNKLFAHGHYDPANLGRSLRALFGKTRLNECLKDIIVPVYAIDSARADQENQSHSGRLSLIQEGSHAIWLNKLGLAPADKQADISVYDAVMASTAAPTYFPSHDFTVTIGGRTQNITGIDGSVFDNPCITYMGALRQYLPEDLDIIMIALGTGRINKKVTKSDWDKYGALGVVDPANDFPLINIFFHASETALLDTFTQEIQDRLFILNKSLVHGENRAEFPSTELDNGDPKNIKRMKNFAKMIIEEQEESLNTICDLLIKNADNSKIGKSGKSVKNVKRAKGKKDSGKKSSILRYLGLE